MLRNRCCSNFKLLASNVAWCRGSVESSLLDTKNDVYGQMGCEVNFMTNIDLHGVTGQ